jgi:hypothetical protein
MNHRDAEITEIVVVIHESYCKRLSEAVAKLASFGVEIFSTDEDDCVVNGAVETYKLPELEKVDCVNYVRSVMTYIADYPPGDPRNRDVGEDDDQDAAEAV